MANLNPKVSKVLSFAVPIVLAILLAGGVTYALGLWKLPATENQGQEADNSLSDVVNKLRGVQTPVVSNLKAGLPYGYKGAPQTYIARTEAVDVKTDFANPNTNENLTANLEARVYKFTKIVAGDLDLSKGSIFDEVTLNKILNKSEGSFELDVYPVYSKEFKGLTFTPNETKTLEVNFTPNDAGYYAVIFAESTYFENNTGEKSVAFVRVNGQGNLAQGGQTQGTNTTAPQATDSSQRTLPQTGPTETGLLMLGALIALGLGLSLRRK